MDNIGIFFSFLSLGICLRFSSVSKSTRPFLTFLKIITQFTDFLLYTCIQKVASACTNSENIYVITGLKFMYMHLSIFFVICPPPPPPLVKSSNTVSDRLVAKDFILSAGV